METYYGHLKTTKEATLIIEACRQGLLDMVHRRLTSHERSLIKSGSIYVWEEHQAGIKRWTDGMQWSPSRVLGEFLCYKEITTNSKVPIKNGLVKQTFSVSMNGERLHLISYYREKDIPNLKRPAYDPFFSSLAELSLDLNIQRRLSIDSTVSSNSSLSLSPINSYIINNPLLPIQDIAWEKLPSNEDARQLYTLNKHLSF